MFRHMYGVYHVDGDGDGNSGLASVTSSMFFSCICH